MKKEKLGAKIAQAIIAEYKPKTVKEMQEALKDIFGSMFEAILNGEMANHLGYDSNSKVEKATTNRRNGHSDKQLETSMGKVKIEVPRDRHSTFNSEIIPKYKHDVSDIEGKVISMYARGFSQRDISATIDDIFGFKLSAEQISKITDYVLLEQQEWQNRRLDAFYPFMFVDCTYVSLRRDYETKKCAVYTILAYSQSGHKDILGLWINESESKATWMKIFDELKVRGVEDVGFISMDGVSGLEQGAKTIFPGVVVQRCIVHLIRNSLEYIPSKHYKAFTSQLRKVYGAPSLISARAEFEQFCETWSEYPGAVNVWKRHFDQVEQLFDYPSAVRKIMYTTNAIEGVHSSFKKAVKRGSFAEDNSVFKILYLRVMELYKKWANRPIPNWAIVKNQLLLDDRICVLFEKHSII